MIFKGGQNALKINGGMGQVLGSDSMPVRRSEA